MGLIIQDDYKDTVAFDGASGRHKAAAELTEAMGQLWTATSVELKAPKDPKADEKLAPEMLQMLEKADGRFSYILGDEVWEAIHWRRGSFLFNYINHLLQEMPHGSTEVA